MRDQVREESMSVVEDLRGLGISRIAMISGDRESVSRKFAADLGDVEYKAECLPQEKSNFVELVKDAGYHVAFVGDGVNDAPALATSDTGIAMGAGRTDDRSDKGEERFSSAQKRYPHARANIVKFIQFVGI